jgi:hypothetical protein
LIATVANPARANDPATAMGAPFFVSPNPWPKITTGQPPAGAVPPGSKRVNWTWLTPCTAGTPVAVPTAGITFAAVS